MRIDKAVVFIVALIMLGAGVFCQAEEFAINEQFENLDEWIPVTFPKIEKHSEYEIIKGDRSKF